MPASRVPVSERKNPTARPESLVRACSTAGAGGFTPTCPAPLGSGTAELPLGGPRPAILAHGGVHFPLSPFARFLIVATLPQVREDPVLFALLLEAREGPLEVLVIVNDYFRQTGRPPF